MTNPDFEQDVDLLHGAGVAFANDETSGELLVNAVEADEFDSRHQNDIEGLLFLGKLTKRCDIFGHVFVIKTLTRGERLAALLVVKEFEESLGVSDAFQTALLAAAIVTVDGRPLTIPLSPSEDKDRLTRIRANFEIIQDYYDAVLEALYAEYGSLLLRQAQAFAALQGNLSASRPSL